MRVFIAIDVPPDIKRRIREIGSLFEGKGTTMVHEEAIHVTMEFLGELDDNAAESAKKALSEVDFERFPIAVDGLGCFTPEYVKVIFAKISQGSEQCIDLHRKIVEKLKEHKLPVQREEFVPHITLARVKSDVNKFKILELLEKYGTYDFGRFEACAVALKKSVLTPNGPEYSELYELEL